ncbi:hypothetical protein AM593_02583, partial [Mytilus galloprovincialis]
MTLFSTSHKISVIRCSSECALSEDCLGFNFHRKTKICQFVAGGQPVVKSNDILTRLVTPWSSNLLDEVWIKTINSGRISAAKNLSNVDKYTSLSTYQIFPADKRFIKFKIKACTNAFVLLSAAKNLLSPDFYEICIGGGSNKLIFLRKRRNGSKDLEHSFDAPDEFYTCCYDEEELQLMVLKDKQALCENLKYILSVPDLCDVTFLVGPEQYPIHGLRAILASRSRLFYMIILAKEKEIKIQASQKKIGFLKKLKEIRKLLTSKPSYQTSSSSISRKLTIVLEEFKPSVFERLVRYIHCGMVSVDVFSVVGMTVIFFLSMKK